MNNIVVSGRLTKDGEIFEGDGFKLWKSSVAVQRDYKEKGKSDYITDFFDITAFGNTADYLSRNAKKGDAVIIQGKLQFDEYKAKDGTNKKSAYIKIDNINVLVKFSSKDANATNSVCSTELTSTNADFIECDDADDIPF